MTQEIHLSQVKATGTPTSHGAIMNNQDQHAHPHDHDLRTIDEAAGGLLRTPKPLCAIGATSAPDLAASASAAASSTAPTTSTTGSPPNTTMTDPTWREAAGVHEASQAAGESVERGPFSPTATLNRRCAGAKHRKACPRR